MQGEKIRVTATFIEPLLGTVPKNREVYADFIATKAPEGSGVDDELESIQEIEEKGWTGFHTDDEGPFLLDYQIKGYLKEVGVALQNYFGIKGIKSKIEKYAYVTPRKIRLPGIAPEPLERPLRAMTMQGERVTVTRSDQVPAGSVIEFEIELLPNSSTKGSRAVTLAVLREILEFGERKGLGQWRSGGYGRFSVKIA